MEMLDKTLNTSFGLVTRADKGAELTHDELDKNLENVLHAVLLSDRFYGAEISAIFNATPLSFPLTLSVVADKKYLAWSIPPELAGKVITLYEDTANGRVRISSYTVWNDMASRYGYNYTYTSASSTPTAPTVLATDLFIMTASHTIGNTVTVEVLDFVPPPPPPPPPPPTGTTPPPTGTTGTTVI
jgi:hypothetical protein